MKRHAPATRRNRDPILAELRQRLPARGLVLEIASGSGEHAAYFGPALPELEWQPTDLDAEALASIDAYCTDLPNVRAALTLDASADEWPVARADAIVCCNMIHIAPWEACEGLFRGAARVLASGAPLVLYGPYREGGVHTAESNARFDESLQSRDPRWGVRDLDEVIALASAHGFEHERTTVMPAENRTVTFRRR